MSAEELSTRSLLCSQQGRTPRGSHYDSDNKLQDYTQPPLNPPLQTPAFRGRAVPISRASWFSEAKLDPALLLVSKQWLGGKEKNNKTYTGL